MTSILHTRVYVHTFKTLDKVRAVGYDLADPGVLPTLELRNITAQAFFTEGISESKELLNYCVPWLFVMFLTGCCSVQMLFHVETKMKAITR